MQKVREAGNILVERFTKWNDRLKALRVLNNWSQEEAANHIGVAQKTYWNWEKGITAPRGISKRAIAQAFKCRVLDIFDDEF